MRCGGDDPVFHGLVKEFADGSLQAVKYGVITTTPDMPMWERLQVIHDSVRDLVNHYQPDQAGVEELFFARNVTTAITVAQGRGVILLALATAGVPITEYKPNTVKQSISGYGGAKKPQMQEMVRMLLGLDSIPKPDDAADALAIAITDIHSSRYNSLM
ncbi:MAG: crossover junction endodeoxyribonuclease RuvC [Anaerolineae bacterium]|nr:crossover junction endodeoxyribonuclease RuvC [Anaerolineae bacterium]